MSTALLNVSLTNNHLIVQNLAELGRTLARGEILQLSNIANQDISEDVYYQVIKQKTAALFESCCAIAALSCDVSEEQICKAKKFGQDLGIIFQIKDDIFDYFDSEEIGKPTGNDMSAELQRNVNLSLCIEPAIWNCSSVSTPAFTTLIAILFWNVRSY